MKVAIRFALPAALLAVLCVAGHSQTKPADPASPGQPGGTPPAASVPANLPDTPKPTSVPPVESDPAKLAKPAVQNQAASSDPSYVIGARDIIAVQIWGDARLSCSCLVRPDGYISLNLIGEVKAAGLTPSELEKSVGELLKQKQILVNPQVAVQVNQINSKEYFLQGEVLKTGSFPLVVPTTVLEALVNAGGFRDFANKKKIEIIRGTERFRFNYNDVIHGKHTEQNIPLKPGDIIIVP